jgi:uncharacterized membrane-anchored protein
MFSQGQLIFAVIFAISFIILIVYSYRKDKRIHTIFYKNTIVVLLCFFIFIAVLFGIKTIMKS